MTTRGECGARLKWGALCVLCLLATACAWPLEREPPVPRARVEELARNWLRAWESGDRELLRSTLHPQMLFAYPSVRADAARTLASFDEFHRDFTDTRVYLHQIQVDGNRFTVEYQFATTRRSNNKRQAVGTVALGEVRDDRIVLVKEYVDGRVSRMQEAGQLPLAEGEEPFPWPRQESAAP
ncbi:MAG: nuclear transport factor 2 family protein [Gammaproteobacteria bacterium]